jgi:hypothetical protein
VLRGSWQVDRYVVMRNPFIPPVQGPAGSFFNDGLLIVLAGKAADCVHADEKCDRGKHDLLAVTTAQQARAAEALDILQMPADLSFVMTLVVVGCGLRCPSTPDPRDHLSPFAGRSNPDGTITGPSEVRPAGGAEPRRNAGWPRRLGWSEVMVEGGVTPDADLVHGDTALEEVGQFLDILQVHEGRRIGRAGPRRTGPCGRSTGRCPRRRRPGPFGLIRYVRLDITTAAEIVDLLRLTRQSGLAIALVSHDEALLAAVADRIVRIRDGTTTARP